MNGQPKSSSPQLLPLPRQLPSPQDPQPRKGTGQRPPLPLEEPATAQGKDAARTAQRWDEHTWHEKTPRKVFPLHVTPFGPSDRASERRWEALCTYPVFLRWSQAAGRAETTHAVMTQLVFTQIPSSQFFNAHGEPAHPFLSCYWHGGSRPCNLRTIWITRNKMKTVFRETCIYC